MFYASRLGTVRHLVEHIMSDHAPISETTGFATGAAAALAGYDFQTDVSIFAALRLMFVTKLTKRIVLEPANAEDVEAELAPGSDEPLEGRSVLGGRLKLVIQVKLRNGEPWTTTDFEALLRHGTRRAPAWEHLNDPDVRYLLVTNAATRGVVRNLRVSSFEEAPDPDGLPTQLKGWLPADSEGRVAIFDGLSPRLLGLEIDEVLTQTLRVPQVRQAACLAALREEARSRMRGSFPGAWLHDDLLATIRAHGGFLSSAAALDTFVPPANFDAMKQMLAKRNAVVVIGPSGTGKTIAALALCEYVRERNGSLDPVIVGPNDDAATIRQIGTSGPKLFYLEDPWGQYSLKAESEAWTAQLPRLLRAARPDCQYVVTSRSDMLETASARREMAGWSVELGAEDYEGGQFAKIYDRRMRLLSPDLQTKAYEFRQLALDKLTTPLELDIYFSQLALGPEGNESDGELLARLTRLAHRDAVEGVVQAYLQKLDPGGQSLVIWALLAARGRVERREFLALRRSLREVDADLVKDLEKLVDRLVVTRHLKQPLTSFSFAHPSVRAGFEGFLRKDWFGQEPVVATLLLALTQMTGEHRGWGVETAARILDGMPALLREIGDEALPLRVPDLVQAALDTWFDEALTDPSADFPRILPLAADVGSSASPPCELARWLLNIVQRGPFHFMEGWVQPLYPDDFYDRLAADPRSHTIADRFIRELLPFDQGSYNSGFPAALGRIADGLAPAYIGAAARLVGSGAGSNVDAVVTGALVDLDAFELHILPIALDDVVQPEAGLDENRRTKRAVEDGETDYGFEEYFESDWNDNNYASSEMLGYYVRKVRATASWQRIDGQSRASELSWYWARDVHFKGAAASTAELRALFAAARDGNHEARVWDALRSRWDPVFAPELLEALVSDRKDEDLRAAQTACAVQNDWRVVVAAFERLAAEPTSLIELLVDLHEGQSSIGAHDRSIGIRPLLRHLAPELLEVFRALPWRERPASAVGSSATRLLVQASLSARPNLLGAIIPVLLCTGARPVDAIRRLLRETDDKELAVVGASAATAVDDDEATRLALNHSRADARRIAFEFLASKSGEPLPHVFLAMVEDPGRRVRQSLLDAMRNRPHETYIPVLLKLASDRYSNADPVHNQPDCFPIARDAVDALRSYGQLDEPVGRTLIALAVGTTDLGLRELAFEVAADGCGLAVRESIWAIVEEQGAGSTRVASFRGLALASVDVPKLATVLTDERILRMSLPFAPAAIVYVCRHFAIDDAVRICEQMGHSPTHRVLLVLGAATLAQRAPSQARRLLESLPGGATARRLLDPQASPLPQEALDGLGDPRLTRVVHPWFRGLVAMR